MSNSVEQLRKKLKETESHKDNAYAATAHAEFLLQSMSDDRARQQKFKGELDGGCQDPAHSHYDQELAVSHRQLAAAESLNRSMKERNTKIHQDLMASKQLRGVAEHADLAGKNDEHVHRARLHRS